MWALKSCFACNVLILHSLVDMNKPIALQQWTCDNQSCQLFTCCYADGSFAADMISTLDLVSVTQWRMLLLLSGGPESHAWAQAASTLVRVVAVVIAPSRLYYCPACAQQCCLVFFFFFFLGTPAA